HQQASWPGSSRPSTFLAHGHSGLVSPSFRGMRTVKPESRDSGLDALASPGNDAPETQIAGHRRTETPSLGRLSPAMTESAAICRSAAKAMREHFLQDLAADRLVGEGAVVPPPAVRLHLGRGCDEAFGDLGEIGV